MRFKDLNLSAPYIPGKEKKPKLPEATECVSKTNFRTHEIFQLGLELHKKDYHWEAHEVWESLWRLQNEGPEKILLKALIQLTASKLKIIQGERDAGTRLFKSAQALAQKAIGNHKNFLGMSLDSFQKL